MKNTKTYIQYSYPDTAEASVMEIWNNGERPKKKTQYVYVYDDGGVVDGKSQLINEREWDGVE